MCPGSPPIFKRPILILRTLRSSARRNPTAHPCALPATNLLSCSLAQPSPLRVLPENSIRRGFASSGRIIASLRTMLAILHLLGMLVADLFKSRSRLDADNLFLRHQLRNAIFGHWSLLLRSPEETLDIGMSRPSTSSALRLLTHDVDQEDVAVRGAET